jgi:hypothetical protein
MTEPAKKVRIRVAEAVEAGVEGILLFVVRYFRTCTSLMTSPRSMARQLLRDRHAAKPAYVLPLTYLSIGLFLLSLLSQVAGLSIFDWIWFVDDIAAKVTEALGKEISLVKVAVQALPGVAVVALFGLVLRVALHQASISGRMVPFVLSYAFGVQAWALFTTAFGFVVLGTLVGKWEPPGGKIGSNLFAAVVYLALFGGLLAALISPLIFAISALRLRRFMRRSRGLGRVVVSLLAVGFVFGHVALLYAIGLPSKVIVLGSGPTTPDITIRHQQYVLAGGNLKMRMPLMIKNRDTKPLAWETGKSAVHLFERSVGQLESTCSNKGAVETLQADVIIDGNGRPAHFVTIDPGQTQWVEFTLSIPERGWIKAALKAKQPWDLRVSIQSVAGSKAEQCTEGSPP